MDLRGIAWEEPIGGAAVDSAARIDIMMWFVLDASFDVDISIASFYPSDDTVG